MNEYEDYEIGMMDDYPYKKKFIIFLSIIILCYAGMRLM